VSRGLVLRRARVGDHVRVVRDARAEAQRHPGRIPVRDAVHRGPQREAARGGEGGAGEERDRSAAEPGLAKTAARSASCFDNSFASPCAPALTLRGYPLAGAPLPASRTRALAFHWLRRREIKPRSRRRVRRAREGPTSESGGQARKETRSPNVKA